MATLLLSIWLNQKILLGVFLLWSATASAFAPHSRRSLRFHPIRMSLSSPTSSSSSTSEPPKRRKKKANKYQQFSKINQDADPLETLIAESEQKNELLLQQKQTNRLPLAAQQQQAMITETPRAFPNTATIDPYDPSTFGYITLGTIQGAHGVQGWVKVRAAAELTDATILRNSFTAAGMVHVRLPNKRAPRATVLLQGKATTNDQFVVHLQNIQDRDQAATLRGAVLYIRHEQLPSETVADEYNVADLVGMPVFLNDNSDAYVGIVAGIVFGEDISSIPGGHDYIELLLSRSDVPSYKDELVLIPFVPQLVPVVDLEQRRIQIDPPTGLLDLTYVRSDKVRVKGFLAASAHSLD